MLKQIRTLLFLFFYLAKNDIFKSKYVKFLCFIGIKKCLKHLIFLLSASNGQTTCCQVTKRLEDFNRECLPGCAAQRDNYRYWFKRKSRKFEDLPQASSMRLVSGRVFNLEEVLAISRFFDSFIAGNIDEASLFEHYQKALFSLNERRVSHG